MATDTRELTRCASIAVGLTLSGLAAEVAGLVIAPAHDEFPPTLLIVGMTAAAGLFCTACFVSAVRRFCAALAAGVSAVIWLVPGYNALHNTTVGVVSAALPAIALGGLLALIGSVLLALPRTLTFQLRWRAFLPGGVALASAMVLVGVIVPVWVGLPATVTTTTATGAPAVPGSVTAVRWSWKAPGRVSHVVAAGTGVVLATSDELIAIDGTSGRQRWRQRRDGAAVSGLVATPDGRTVATMSIGIDASPPDDGLVAAFDAFTGEQRWQRPSEDLSVLGAATNGTVLGMNDRLSQLVGLDLADGTERWRRTPPEHCTPPASDDLIVGAVGAVLLPLCGPDPAHPFVQALNDRTGESLHRVPVPSTKTSGLVHEPHVAVLAGGTIAKAVSDADQYRTPPGSAVTFDPRTGAPRATPPASLVWPYGSQVILADGSQLRLRGGPDEPGRVERTAPDGQVTTTPLPAGTSLKALSEFVVAPGAIVLSIPNDDRASHSAPALLGFG
ncbi:PQQ-binding-like beta-propeller repeat protein [Spirillospora sp. CA-128828]|uniref:outer membrane protein assembly factor BamB family protein n=1 Tax=Spirillospora sp. CA-128828 TaxID=3240033 RepID=UPI003D8B1F9A